MNSKLILLGSISLLACLSSAASAQSNPPSMRSTTADPSVQAPAEEGIGEITVTAQRRTESLQKSSVSIEVLGGADLVRRGVSEARDLTTSTPSITISQNGAYTQTSVRGAGDTATNIFAQPAVSYSIDGVAVGLSLGISPSFYDLARVEVLKGPQGTLYGRNATGGAVNIITARPTQKFEGFITAEYGNYDAKRLTGAINVPLSDTLAMRGAFNIVDRDGYLSDGTDDDVRQSGRLQALWKPTSTFSLRLAGSYSHTGGKGGGVVLFPRQPGTGRWTAVSDPINNAAIAAGSVGLHVPFGTDSRLDLKQWDISAEANLDLDFATLTVIPSYRETNLNQLTYNYGQRTLLTPQKTRQTSVEARLGHQDATLKWTVGGFYFDLPASYRQITSVTDFVSGFATDTDVKATNKSYAVFGEATYALTDRVRAIGGIRYTHDKVGISGTITDLSLTASNGTLYPQAGSKGFNAVTWRAGAEYDVTPQSMAYFTVSKGYKSGGFVYVTATTDNTFEPERLTAFTLGLRNRFFDNKLQFNLEAYYWNYKDQQIPGVGFTSNGNIAYLTRNAGASKPRGIDADIVFKPTRLDTLNLALSYTRARFSSFDISFPAPLIATVRAGALCRIPSTSTNSSSGFPVYLINCSGAPLPRTPEWSGSFGYQHLFEMESAGTILASVNGTFASSRYLAADFYVPEAKDGAYALLNADLTYTTSGDRFSITAFVRNIANKAVYQGGIADTLNGFGDLLGVPGTPTFYERTIGAPRTYGVRATLNF